MTPQLLVKYNELIRMMNAEKEAVHEKYQVLIDKLLEIER